MGNCSAKDSYPEQNDDRMIYGQEIDDSESECNSEFIYENRLSVEQFNYDTNNCGEKPQELEQKYQQVIEEEYQDINQNKENDNQNQNNQQQQVQRTASVSLGDLQQRDQFLKIMEQNSLNVRLSSDDRIEYSRRSQPQAQQFDSNSRNSHEIVKMKQRNYRNQVKREIMEEEGESCQN